MPKKGKKTRQFSVLLSITLSIFGIIGSVFVLLNQYITHFWLGELVGLFSVQWAVLMIFLGLLAWIKKQRFSALLLLAFSICFLYPIGKTYFGSSSSTPTSTQDSYRILSFELGVSDRNTEALLEFIYTEDADVLYLQNVRISDNSWLDELKLDYAYHKVLTREGGYGIAVFSKKKWTTLQVVDFELPAHPSVSMRQKIGRQSYEFLFTHLFAPVSVESHNVRVAQTTSLTSWIEGLPEEVKPILMGPLFLGHQTASRAHLLKKGELKDASSGFGWTPTWPQQTSLTKTVADHLFIHKSIPAPKLYRVGPNLGSEHLPLIIDLHLQ